jgi:hypothetical protein
MALYYVMLHEWIAVGTSEFAIRLLSVLFAVVTIPTVYALGCSYGQRVGIIAAFFLALNAFAIEYAQYARGYSLALWLVTLASLFYLRSVERPTTSRWIGYVLATTLAIYTHLFAVLVFAAQWVALALSRPKGAPWKGLILSSLAVGLLTLPLAVFVLFRNTGQVSWIPRLSLNSIYPLFYLTGGMPWFDRVPGRLLILGYGVLSAMGGVALWKFRGALPTGLQMWRGDFLVAWLVVPVVLVLIVSLVSPIFVFRYFIIILPALIILVALGASQIRSRAMFAAVMTVMVLLMGRSILVYHREYANEDWRGTTHYILSDARAGDRLLFYAPYARTPYDYYVSRTSNTSLPTVIDDATGKTLTQISLATRLPCSRRVWLVLSHDHENGDTLGDAIQADLAHDRNQLSIRRFGDIRVLLYDAAAVPGRISTTPGPPSLDCSTAP